MQIVLHMEKILHNSERIKVVKEKNNQLFFEIENELTSDLSEAVAMVIMLDIHDEHFWTIPYKHNNDISSEKTLYWLSGGDNEWVSKHNYNISWSEVYQIYVDKFENTIFNILKESKTFEDIRNGFIKHLNLPLLYEFALDNEFAN